MKISPRAHPNQMPLRKISLDKTGNDTQAVEIEDQSLANKKISCTFQGGCRGTESPSLGSFDWPDLSCDPRQGSSNNPICSTLGSGWTCKEYGNELYNSVGSTADSGCSEGYVEFYMDLTCPSVEAEQKTWASLDPITKAGAIAFLQSKGLVRPAYVCVYKPRVQAMDNWGWCTGSCDYGVSNIRGGGCYEDYKSYNQCAISENYPHWIQYPDPIIVVPTGQ